MKGKKTGGRDFVPGDPRAGRPPLPDHVKEAKRLTKTELESIINKYLFAPLADIRKAAEDESLPTIESWMVAILLKGRTTGEWSGYEWIAQRLVGKIPDRVEVQQVTPFVIRHTTGEQTVLGAEVKKLDEGKD